MVLLVNLDYFNFLILNNNIQNIACHPVTQGCTFLVIGCCVPSPRYMPGLLARHWWNENKPLHVTFYSGRQANPILFKNVKGITLYTLHYPLIF